MDKQTENPKLPAKRKKTGGRKKGTLNKTSAELKEKILWFQNIGMERLEKFMNDKKKTEEEKLLLWCAIAPKLTKFVLPIQTEGKMNLDEELTKSFKESMDKINGMF